MAKVLRTALPKLWDERPPYIVGGPFQRYTLRSRSMLMNYCSLRAIVCGTASLIAGVTSVTAQIPIVRKSDHAPAPVIRREGSVPPAPVVQSPEIPVIEVSVLQPQSTPVGTGAVRQEPPMAPIVQAATNRNTQQNPLPAAPAGPRALPPDASPAARGNAVVPPILGLPDEPFLDGSWNPVPSGTPAPTQQMPRTGTPALPASFAPAAPATPAAPSAGPAAPRSMVVASAPLPQDWAGQAPVASEPQMWAPAGAEGCNSCYQPAVGTTDCQDCGPMPARPTGLFGFNSMLGTGPLLGMRYDGSGNGSPYGMYGNMPDANAYAFLEGLYWTRNDDGMIGTNFGGVGGDEWSFGGRFTLGSRIDRVSGVELSYMGLSPIEFETAQSDPTNSIDALFTPGAGFGATQLSAFFNASDTFQQFATDLQSFSFKRVHYAWDVARSHYGLRVIYMRDQYQLDSTAGANVGRLGVGARNVMIGPEIGADFLYDVGRQVSFSWGGKVGGYVNAAEVNTELFNNGTQFLDNRDRQGRAGASLELGANIYYHVTRYGRMKLGYNTLWLWGVASANDNYPFLMTPFTGVNADTSDNTFFHGLNFGIEVYR